jgi:hypothetical protein
MKCA